MFYEKLKEQRTKLGASQEEVAAILKVTVETVVKWESGISMPDLENAIKLSEMFGVTIDYLLKDRKSNSNFSYYTTVKEERRVISSHKLISLVILIIAIMTILTLFVVSWVEPIIYISGSGDEFYGIQAYMHEYSEFNTAFIFSISILILSAISLFVPEHKLRQLFNSKI